MSRPIEIGDIIQVKIGNTTQEAPITNINLEAGQITATPYIIIWNGTDWKIKGWAFNHTITFSPKSVPEPLTSIDDLKILTLNLGYNVMTNQVAGSEAPLVQACQQAYAGGWKDASQRISMCTYNAAKLIAKYNLFGLQEVHYKYAQVLMQTIQNFNPSAKFRFIPGYGIVTGYDENITGEGISLTEIDHRLVDRALQAIWFPRLELVFVNLHAPRDVDYVSEIQKSIAGIQAAPKHVIVVGDFNDYTYKLRNKSIPLFGLQVRMPGESPLTCCADRNYIYPGDYILTSYPTTAHYGYPPGYIRFSPLLSDHDPVSLESLAKYTGVVTIAGTNTEVLLTDTNPDYLFSKAQEYVRNQKLDWIIQKPRAWSKPTSGPHISLLPEMQKYLGEPVPVKLKSIYHFSDHNTRWVVYDVELPPKFKCGYECHLSIGQQN